MPKVIPNEVIELEHIMDPSRYRLWLTALKNDNSTEVDNILSAADELERDKLLNGMFHFSKMPVCLQEGGFLGTAALQLTRPWCVAAVAGSHSVMISMLKYKLNVAQKELDGNNIIHILIYTAFLEPSLENPMIRTYEFLMGTLHSTELETLLLDTNESGYRPIEYAAHLGVFRLLQRIFRTEGIYMVREEINSLYSIEWFKVTEYERPDKANRHRFSPLYLLMLVEEDKISETATDDFFATPLIQNWTKLKLRTNSPVIILWFLIRMLFLSAFLLGDKLTGKEAVVKQQLYKPAEVPTTAITSFENGGFASNRTAMELDCVETQKYVVYSSFYGAIIIYITSHAFLMIVHDIIEGCMFLKQLAILKTPKGWKRPAVNYFFYRFMQFFQALMILLYQVALILRYFVSYDFSLTLLNFIYIQITMSLVWSFLFFAQLLPWIGDMVIAIQAMVMKLFKFLFIFCAFTLCFTGTFQHLMSIGRKASECLPEFATFGESFYTMFTVMLNMVNFRQLLPADPASIYLLHVIYVFMTAILLINFLIALFSTSSTQIDEHKQVIQAVQRLSVSWMIEHRLHHWVCPYLHHCFNWKTFPIIQDGDFAVPCLVASQKTKD